MKSKIKLFSLSGLSVILFSVLLTSQSCERDEMNPGNAGDPTAAKKENLNTRVVNLVSDTAQYAPAHIDPNLVNAWGISFSPGGGIWVSSNELGFSTIYDKDGNTLRPPVVIPFPGGSNPTGQVYNSTTGFVIPSNGQVSKFIFATEDGTIAAWSGGDSAITVVDRSSMGTVYKGIEMASSNGSWLLYATDLHNARVDVFDQNFHYVSKTFSDPGIPSGFAPFNIRFLKGKLFVTYAKQLPPDNHDDEAGPGNGYVDIYNTDGSLVKRFASTGVLNSPWGLEILQGKDQDGDDNDQGNRNMKGGDDDYKVLVGNFGDGHINVFNSNGKSLHPFMNKHNPVVIDGLWAITYPPQTAAYSSVSNWLYFTAGPQSESHSIFGYILKQ